MLLPHHIHPGAFLDKGELTGTQQMGGMIEEIRGVESNAIDPTFKMQMLGGGSACAPCECYHLSGFHLVAHLDKVL